MFRKNCPFNFVDTVNLCLEHPNTRFLDKQNLLLGLQLFDFDINELNSGRLLAEQGVIMTETLKSEVEDTELNAYERFYSISKQENVAL